uniref:Uncharacterized protein n=1 Tax=Cucumis melo TaxID=3656 RepID=A0A9I9EBL5_CUCME
MTIKFNPTFRFLFGYLIGMVEQFMGAIWSQMTSAMWQPEAIRSKSSRLDELKKPKRFYLPLPRCPMATQATLVLPVVDPDLPLRLILDV